VKQQYHNFNSRKLTQSLRRRQMLQNGWSNNSTLLGILIVSSYLSINPKWPSFPWLNLEKKKVKNFVLFAHFSLNLPQICVASGSFFIIWNAVLPTAQSFCLCGRIFIGEIFDLTDASSTSVLTVKTSNPLSIMKFIVLPRFLVAWILYLWDLLHLVSM